MSCLVVTISNKYVIKSLDHTFIHHNMEEPLVNVEWSNPQDEVCCSVLRTFLISHPSLASVVQWWIMRWKSCLFYLISSNSDNFITIRSCKVPGKVFTLSEWLRYLREGVNLKCNILYQLLVKFLFVVL